MLPPEPPGQISSIESAPSALSEPSTTASRAVRRMMSPPTAPFSRPARAPVRDSAPGGSPGGRGPGGSADSETHQGPELPQVGVEGVG